MHVLQVSFFQDPQERRPELLLSQWYSLVDVAESVATSGARVSVAQASQYSEQHVRGDVGFHFVRPDSPSAPMVRGREFRELLARLSPDVLHVHGLAFPRDVGWLQKLAPDVPVLLQDHANSVPRFWRRPAWRRGFASVDAVAFTAREQVAPFIAAGVVPAGVQICEYPGTAPRFVAGDQRAARELTGLHGDPCLLWVGHLDPNKDPLTVLRGFATCLDRLPDAQLWCCYGAAPLLDAVHREIAAQPALAARVHLLGAVDHARIEHLMHAADLFVLGSHREGSGFALMEALSTGLVPVVSDIPSFRALTAGGTVGAVWQAGNPRACADAILRVTAGPRAAQRRAALAHFARELCAEAGGRKLHEAYQAIVERRRGRARTRAEALA